MPSIVRGNDNFETEQYRSLQDRTWQDMTSGRSAGVTYTNSTGRDIYISVSTNSSADILLSVGGVTEVAYSYSSGAGDTQTVTAIVPDGDTYIAGISNGTLKKWAELR